MKNCKSGIGTKQVEYWIVNQDGDAVITTPFPENEKWEAERALSVMNRMAHQGRPYRLLAAEVGRVSP